jgi:hypothetical protein
MLAYLLKIEDKGHTDALSDADADATPAPRKRFGEPAAVWTAYCDGYQVGAFEAGRETRATSRTIRLKA